MADHLHDLIIKVFDEGFARDRAEADEIRNEIKTKGTYWAGGEIWKLRRLVASLRRRLAEMERDEQ